MAKLSVLRAARDVWRFALANYLRILGIVWLPLGLTIYLRFWVYLPLIDASWRAIYTRGTRYAIVPVYRTILFETVFLLLAAIMTHGLTRLAFGDTPRFAYLYLPTARSFLRLCLWYGVAWLIAAAVFALFSVVGAVWTTWTFSNSSLGGKEQQFYWAFAGRGGLTLIMDLVLAVLWIRTTFVLPALVLQGRGGVGSNWAFTRGNFWRCAAVQLLVYVPSLALGLEKLSPLSFFSISRMALTHAPALDRPWLTWTLSATDAYTSYWYGLVPLAILAAPLLYAPMLAVNAFAFKQLDTGK